jgi:L,D-transpeptidase YcbB
MRRLSALTAVIFVVFSATSGGAEDADGTQSVKPKDPAVGESWSSDKAPAGDVPAVDLIAPSSSSSSSSSQPAAETVAVADPDPSSVTTHHAGPAETPASDRAALGTGEAPSPPQSDGDPGLDAKPTPIIEKEPATPEPDAQRATAPVVPSNPPFLIGEDVRDIVARARVSDDVKPDLRAVSAFYAARRGEVAWTTAKGLTPEALRLVAELKQAADWGLDQDKIDLPSDNVVSKSKSGGDLERAELADAEMKLSLSALIYARQASGGRIPEPKKQLTSYLDRAPTIKEPSLILEDLAGSTEPDVYLRRMHPQHPQFEKLRQSYIELRSKADAARRLVRIPGGAKIKPGEKNEQIALLRERLNVPPAPGADVDVYDPALVEAVKAVQAKNELRADGIIGKTTRAALNDIELPSPERVLANMEQWRWMPKELGSTYIQVNVPEFMFRVIKDGEVVHEERVVTGQTDKQTPAFSDIMETVIFHPRWNVPESIKILELYPNLARGGGSFQRQGLKLMRNGREISPSSVNWSQADIRAYDVYQPSGPSNVLGEIKFIFPNKHGVYMHDTVAKRLFNEPSRPFSHGCMRVRDPRKFAEVLLSLDKGWDRTQIDGILDSGSIEELPVPLETKIPVHVTYFTSVVDDTGALRSFKDVYGHEQRIKLALAGRFDQIAIGPDHLAPVKFERVRYAAPDDDWNSFFGSDKKNQKFSKKKSGGFFGFYEEPEDDPAVRKNGKPLKQGKQARGNGANNDFLNNLFGNF